LQFYSFEVLWLELFPPKSENNFCFFQFAAAVATKVNLKKLTN